MRSRLIIGLALLVCLVATNLVTMAWTTRRAHALDNPPPAHVDRKFPLLARQLGDTSAPALQVLRPLRERLEALVASQPGRAAVYIELLNNRGRVGVNQSVRFWPASLAKVPIAITVLKTIEDGIWDRAKTFKLQAEDRASVSSELNRLPIGTPLSITQLLEALLERSDNTAYNILLRNLPPEELDELKKAIGLDDLFDAEGRITAKEYSRFFESLYFSTYLREQDSQYLLALLGRSNFNMFLRKGLPPSVGFSHKWGSLPQQNTYSDVGIVYAGETPYLITVLVQGDGSPTELAKVQQFMHDVSAMAYDFVTTGR